MIGQQKQQLPTISPFKKHLLSNKRKNGELIILLQTAQDTYGYIPESSIDYISEVTRISPAEIYGVITFYAQFRTKPFGKYLIKICEGTACHVNGAKNIIKALQNELQVTVGETTEDGLFTLQSVACLGCCSLSPAMMINGQTYGRLDNQKIKKIIRQYKKQETPE